MLSQYGYQLKASKPNKQGLCMFTLVKGRDEIKIDRACTLDEAMAAAQRFIERELEEKAKRQKKKR